MSWTLPPTSTLHLVLALYPFFPSTQTYIGSILVSVNPYKLLNIYGTDMVLQYAGRGLSDNPP